MLSNNKYITGITYNYLNLPSVITVTGKGTITYTYDATGNKLKKVTQENAATVPFNGTNYTSNITTTTTYIGSSVYESKAYSNSSLASLQYTDVLQFMAHEEGRIRPVRDGSGNITSFTYDYFLKDHLGNVRMVLTEQKDTSFYPPASMEAAQATTEEALYANLPQTRTGISSIAGYPTDNYTNPNAYVAKTNGSGNKIGPSIILKVMAGDQFNIRVSSWYKKNGSNPGSPNSIATDLVTSLINSLTGTGGPVHGAITSAQLTSSGVVPTSVNSFLSNQPAPGSTKPKAYLNWVFLDEQFKFAGGSAAQVGDDNILYPITKDASILNAPKNGYLYVFVSNETPNIDVYFDNLQVTHIRGPILEETHYYPFGLTMAGISSKSAGLLQNRNLYNSKELQNKEFSDGSGLETYDYLARMQDPQIGRFWQIDPSAASYHSWTPYNYVGNNPVLITDPDGKDWVVSIEEDKKGNKIYNITVNGVLYNNSSNSSIDMAKLQASIEKQVGDVYNFSGEGFSVRMNFNLRTVTSLDDVKKTDHVFQVVDQKYVSKGALAEAELNGLNIKIGADMVNNIIDNKNTRTVAHELGHTAGWNHPHDSKGKADPKTAWEAMSPNQMRKNLMSQTWFAQTQNGTTAQNISTDLTYNQMILLRSNATTGNLNKNSPLYNKLGVSFVRLTPFTPPVPIMTREKALRR